MPRPAQTLSTERLKELARAGAEKVLNELRADIIAIERTFPELALAAPQAAARSLKRVQRRGSRMSASARKAVSARMKKYWAERRRAKAKLK